MSLVHFNDYLYEDEKNLKKKLPSSESPTTSTESNPVNKASIDKNSEQETMSQEVIMAMNDYFEKVHEKMEKIKEYVNIKPNYIVTKKKLKIEIDQLTRDIIAKKSEFERLFNDEDFEFMGDEESTIGL